MEVGDKSFSCAAAVRRCSLSEGIIYLLAPYWRAVQTGCADRYLLLKQALAFQ
jgi:hypothetical protein